MDPVNLLCDIEELAEFFKRMEYFKIFGTIHYIDSRTNPEEKIGKIFV
jgi:hypothetical protein